MSRERYGQNIMETAIIIAVISIAAILALMFLGKEINTTFSLSHTAFAGYNPFGFGNNATPKIQAGSLGGTPSSPVSKCSDGLCAIDYGDFALNGISENFGELIETAGTSAGTDELFDMMAQIADQIENNDPSNKDAAADFRLIANLGHFSADIQEIGEKAAKECMGNADPKACFTSKSNNFKPSDVAIPEDMQKILPKWPTPTKNTGYSVDSFNQILGKIDLGWAAAGWLNSSQKQSHPSGKIIEAYKRIMASDSGDGVTPEMKEIATSLIKQVDTLNDNLKNIYFKTESRKGQWSNYDPITGKRDWERGSGSGELLDIFEPKTSKNTDLRAVIFCATGDGKSNGYNCK